MCINKKWIWLDHGRRRMLVNCGHCPDCQQEKADRRSERIRNTVRPGYQMLFVTLTYCDECCPYILRDDLLYAQKYGVDDIQSVPVYRDSVDYHSERMRTNYEACLKQYRKFLRGESNFRYYAHSKRTYGTHIIASKDLDPYSVSNSDFATLKTLRNSKDSRRVGVIYYEDLQKFLKRFRIYLDRDYGYKQSVIYFACAEIGPTYGRPHFHLLIECPNSYYNVFKSAIVKAWPYDNNRVCQYVEIARNASSYVSSYVNCGNNVPLLFKSREFKQKHSFSPALGFGTPEFSLPSVIEKIRRGNLTYSREVVRNGVKTSVDVPIPKYVINRYFPKFKGFSRLTTNEICGLLQFPERVYEDETLSAKLGIEYRLRPIDVDPFFHLEDKTLVYLTIRNKLDFYKHVLEEEYNNPSVVTVVDYIFAWSRVWQLYSSMLLRMSHEIHEFNRLPDFEFYDNIDEIVSGDVGYTEFVDYFGVPMEFFDPNRSKTNLIRHNYLFDKYNRYDKSRKLINFDMTRKGCNV